jgi:hypothetical protein
VPVDTAKGLLKTYGIPLTVLFVLKLIAPIQILGTVDLKGVAKIDTKIFPRPPGEHAPEKLKATFQTSLAALGKHKIRVFYLHAPDRATPFEQTLRAVDELYKEGHLCVQLTFSSTYLSVYARCYQRSLRNL